MGDNPFAPRTSLLPPGEGSGDEGTERKALIRSSVATLALCADCACAATVALAAYPDHPLRLILGYPQGSTPAEFGAYLRSEIPKWTKVVRDSGAKPE